MTPEEEAEIDKLAQKEFVAWLVMQRRHELVDEYLGASEDTGWDPVKLTGLSPSAPPSVCEVGPGVFLFTPGKIHLVYGAGTSGKTWVMLFAAAQEVKKGNLVLLIDYEMGGADVVDRLHALGLIDAEIDEGIVYVNPQMTLTKQKRSELVDAVEDRIAEGRLLTFAGLDSLTESATMDGLNENDTNDMTQWFRSTTRWIVRQWPTCAVAIIDHLPKDKPDAPFPIGSQRKQSASHALVSVRNVVAFDRTNQGHSLLAVRRSRDGHLPVGPVARLDIGPDRIAVGPPSSDDAKVVREMQMDSDIIDFIQQNQGALSGEVAKGVKGSTTAVLARLKALIDVRVVREDKQGNSHRHYIDDGEVFTVPGS